MHLDGDGSLPCTVVRAPIPSGLPPDDKPGALPLGDDFPSLQIEHEHRSRGLAYMDVRKLKSLEVIETTSSPQQLIEAEMALKQDLQQTLARRMKLVNPIAYPTWADFVTAMRRHGAALESAPADVIGSPTAHFFVPPGSGNVQVYSVQEQVIGTRRAAAWQGGAGD